LNEDNLKKIKQINFFLARIHWQSHFIQKLESQVDIEYKNLNKEFDKIRNKSDIEIINNFFNAKTGIPYCDAAIKCLKTT
jgi:deoxyribodipyrimidine photo-lyase